MDTVDILAGMRPTHPGNMLRDVVLPETGLTKTEVARRLGVTRKALYDLLDGQAAVSTAMALKLARLFGNSALFWLNMQNAHDLAVKGEEMAAELDAIEPIAA